MGEEGKRGEKKNVLKNTKYSKKLRNSIPAARTMNLSSGATCLRALFFFFLHLGCKDTIFFIRRCSMKKDLQKSLMAQSRIPAVADPAAAASFRDRTRNPVDAAVAAAAIVVKGAVAVAVVGVVADGAAVDRDRNPIAPAVAVHDVAVAALAAARSGAVAVDKPYGTAAVAARTAGAPVGCIVAIAAVVAALAAVAAIAVADAVDAEACEVAVVAGEVTAVVAVVVAVVDTGPLLELLLQTLNEEAG